MPDKIILWLSNEEFPNGFNDIPEHIARLQQLGLEISFCKNIKSYKKLIYSLEKYPNDIIITFDDDHYYSFRCIENLYEAYLSNKKYIHTSRAYKITLNDRNEIDDYNNWIQEIKCNKTIPSYSNFILGGGGTLYTKELLNQDILKEELFMKLSPMGDDIWFWSMAVLNNTKINVVRNNDDVYQIIDLSFDKNWSSLWKKNITENYNDKQIRDIFEYYPEIKNKVLAEIKSWQK